LKHVPVVETLNNPTDEQLVNRELFGGPVLVCPVCQFYCSHVQAVYTLIGGDESEGLYRGSHLVARETDYRRDALAVRVHGECGHLWDIVFQQHKGSTFVRVDVLKNRVTPGEELNLERV
jgi:hypothetical protein